MIWIDYSYRCSSINRITRKLTYSVTYELKTAFEYDELEIYLHQSSFWNFYSVQCKLQHKTTEDILIPNKWCIITLECTRQRIHPIAMVRFSITSTTMAIDSLIFMHLAPKTISFSRSILQRGMTVAISSCYTESSTFNLCGILTFALYLTATAAFDVAVAAAIAVVIASIFYCLQRGALKVLENRVEYTGRRKLQMQRRKKRMTKKHTKYEYLMI